MNQNNNPTIEELFEAWQVQSKRIDQIAKNNPVTDIRTEAIARRKSMFRNEYWTSIIQSIVCFASCMWLITKGKCYVVDTHDLITNIVIGCLLLFCGICIVKTFVQLLRHNPLAYSPLRLLRFIDKGKMHFKDAVNTALIVTVSAILLIVAIPDYDGRVMSSCKIGDRSIIIANIDKTIDNIQSNTK